VEHRGGDYWARWHDFLCRDLLRNGLISAEDLHLYRLTDNVEAAVREVVDFYRVYHSMRYVGDELVLRLTRPIRDSTLTSINTEFGCISDDRRIERIAALPDEAGEFAELPRLKLKFDRRSCGLLRCCIDAINLDPG
jgi:hypothetical protein